MVKVFDLDGTLLDSNGIWRWVDETFLYQYGHELTDEYNAYVSLSLIHIFLRQRDLRHRIRQDLSETQCGPHSVEAEKVQCRVPCSRVGVLQCPPDRQLVRPAEHVRNHPRQRSLRH